VHLTLPRYRRGIVDKILDDHERSASASGDLRIAEASKYYERLYLTSLIRADRMFDRCTRGEGGRERERESERGKERKSEREITRTTWRARLSINFLRISGNRRRRRRCRRRRRRCRRRRCHRFQRNARISSHVYIPREEFYREFGWHEYRLLIGKVIKRCRGSDYRVRGNYRKGKEERPLARSRARTPPRPANMNAIDVFGNISRASAKAIATMDRRNGIRPTIFYVVYQRARSPTTRQLISKTITPRVARGIDLNFASYTMVCSKYRVLDLKLRTVAAVAFINPVDGRARDRSSRLKRATRPALRADRRRAAGSAKQYRSVRRRVVQNICRGQMQQKRSSTSAPEEETVTRSRLD